MKIVLYGSTGWMGSQLRKMLEDLNHNVIPSKCRLDDYQSIGTELGLISPDCVLLSAGLTGDPNIDWCEDHRREVLSVNVIGTSILADECYRRGIHLVYLGTGCIYEYDSSHPMISNMENMEDSIEEDVRGLIENSTKDRMIAISGDKYQSKTESLGFVEEDKPNFDKSFYSYTKIMTENILKEFDNVLILRIRMPLSDELHPRNFITKITKYNKVVNIPNSMSILSDLLPIIPLMIRDRKVGVYNFTNPGVISHNEILSLYKEYVDHDFEWKNFTLEEQDKILKAGRSNNCLDVTKLIREYPVPHIKVSIKKLFEKMSLRYS